MTRTRALPVPTGQPPSRRSVLLAGAAVLGAVALAGCSSGSMPPGPVATTGGAGGGAAGRTSGTGGASRSGGSGGTGSQAERLRAYGLSAAQLTFTVAKSPTCSCCSAWMSYAQELGAQVTGTHPPSLEAAFRDAGIPTALQSCHLATNGEGVLVVGHVPMVHVAKFLKSRTAQDRALVVPGMPIGSPGMDAAVLEPYDVLVLSADGSTRVFARVATMADQLL
ncbi:MAG TPA: DUF411 domain-containing protein [Dermatophilaceae bacterium]|nr:DUF411 domain-containing protein [Dermatophilaceae bacterium]